MNNESKSRDERSATPQLLHCRYQPGKVEVVEEVVVSRRQQAPMRCVLSFRAPSRAQANMYPPRVGNPPRSAQRIQAATRRPIFIAAATRGIPRSSAAPSSMRYLVGTCGS